MTDKPYGLDFFHKITDVHFGGQWFFVGYGAPFGTSASHNAMEIDFPDQAGGTPGFIPTIDTGPPAVVFAPYVASFPPGGYVVKASDLVQQLQTNAGAKVTAFAFRTDGAFPLVMLFKLDHKFPSTPFRTRFRINGSPISVSVSVGTVKRNWMKAGNVIKTFSPFASGTIPTESRVDTVVSTPHDFLINPTTLKVTG